MRSCLLFCLLAACCLLSLLRCLLLLLAAALARSPAPRLFFDFLFFPFFFRKTRTQNKPNLKQSEPF